MCELLAREVLYLRPNDGNAALVGGVEFEDARGEEGRPEEGFGEGEDGAGFAGAGRAVEEHVGELLWALVGESGGIEGGRGRSTLADWRVRRRMSTVWSWAATSSRDFGRLLGGQCRLLWSACDRVLGTRTISRPMAASVYCPASPALLWSWCRHWTGSCLLQRRLELCWRRNRWPLCQKRRVRTWHWYASEVRYRAWI